MGKMKDYRMELEEIHGADFVNEFDTAFDVGLDDDTNKQISSLRERVTSTLLVILQNKAVWYAVGVIDGMIILAAIKYFLVG